MIGVAGAERDRVRLERQLAELRSAFRDAAARRRVARENGDAVAEMTAAGEVEAALRTRAVVVARLADVGVSVDEQGRCVRTSSL